MVRVYSCSIVYLFLTLDFLWISWYTLFLIPTLDCLCISWYPVFLNPRLVKVFLLQFISYFHPRLFSIVFFLSNHRLISALLVLTLNWQLFFLQIYCFFLNCLLMSALFFLTHVWFVLLFTMNNACSNPSWIWGSWWFTHFFMVFFNPRLFSFCTNLCLFPHPRFCKCILFYSFFG